MKRFQLSTALVALSLSLTPALAQNAAPGPVASALGQRPTLVVMDFDYATVSDQLQGKESLGMLISALRGQNPTTNLEQTKADLGQGIAELVVEKLLEEGAFRILERQALQKVLAEQSLAGSNKAAAGQESVAKQAALLGARYMLTGSITKFGSEEKTRGVGLGGLGGVGIGAIGKKSRKTEVAITARLVDTSTGEIVASAKGEGVSTRGGGFAIGGGGALGGLAIGSSSSNVRESAIGEATELAVQHLVQNLVVKKAQLQ